jgi:hypothetical protein
MKRTLLNKSLLKTALAVPAAALMLGSSQGAQIGINFWGNGYAWYNAAYAGKVVTATAFGIEPANWFTTPQTTDDAVARQNTGWPVAPATGGDLSVAWTSANTWSTFIGDLSGWVNCPAGDCEVTWGILDDTSPSWTVTLTGLRNIAADCTVQLITATGGAQDSFPDATLTAINGLATDVQVLDYTNGTYAGVDGGTVATSIVSTAYSMLSSNNTISIKAGPRDDRRSPLAGIILTYTPSADLNPPVIEVNPQAPVGNLYPGNPFMLTSLASGAPTLHYQWCKGGAEIPGATFPSYTNTSAAVGDTGDYVVVVTNSVQPNGAVTSTVAHVTIQNVVSPVITQGPLSQSLYAGYPATFTVAATGGLLSYQWKSNTVVIPGATGTSYTIPSITASSAATYSVDVSNPVGPTATASATLTVKVPAAGSYEAKVAATKPLLWFRYSDTSAPVQDVANNSGSLATAGNGLYIAATHPVTGNLVGSSDTATYFDGASSRVVVPYNASLNSSVFSAEVWAKPASVAANKCVMSCGDFADPRAGWLIYMQTTGWNLRFYNQNGTTVSLDITGGSAPVAGNLYHLVVTFDGTTATLYVNGVATTGVPTGYVPGTAGPFCVGARADNSFWWNGTADEAAFYPTVLTAGQVATHYANGTSLTPSPAYNTLVINDGAVEYLRLDQAAFGGSLVNAGTLGAAWNGTYADAGGVLGSPQIGIGEPGPLPPTYPGFESTNRCVTVTNGYATSPQLPLATNTVTVTCWINRQAISTTSDLSWPAWLGGGGMHLNNGTAANPAAELRYHWNGNNWGWGSGLFVPADTWTFCAMVIEPTKATFYMSSGSTLLSSVDNSTHAAMVVTSPPGFGGNQAGNTGRNFIGQLDETTVYDRALTLSEINTLFMVGTGTPLRLQLNPGGIIQDTKPSGTPHNGVNTGASCTWVASSTDGNSKTCTGVEQFVAANSSQITIAADPDFNSTTGTFMFWMLAGAPLPAPGTEAAMLVDRRTSSGAVITMNDAGYIFVQCAGGVNTGGTYMPDNLWHLVAVTYDQSASGLVGVSIDGNPSLNVYNSVAWSWPTSQQIELGRSHDTYWKRYDGLMEDFRIYNRILTDTEIASVYANSAALVDTSALKLRFEFNTLGIGETVNWPFGTLLSSPTLGPSAVWTPVSGATPPNYPFMPTGTSLFYGAAP